MLHGVAYLVIRRCLQLPVSHELDAQHETRPPHVADDCKNRREPAIERDSYQKDGSFEFYVEPTRSIRSTGSPELTVMLLLESAEAILEVRANDEGVLLELLLLEHLEHGEPARGAQWVAAERVEVAAARQHLRDLRRRHHGAQGDAVADALDKHRQVRRQVQTSERPLARKLTRKRIGQLKWRARTMYLRHGHYVGDDTVGLEPPEVAADAREPRLDLVGDAEPAGLPDLLVRQRQVPRRHLHDPADTLCSQINNFISFNLFNRHGMTSGSGQF